ncbi:MAG TPA: efflux RND transporter permease subunit, partial [Puia sp.]|nr:efflux RND transporter permease subunit [Puia sp.]
PVSILSAVLFLKLSGQTINIMTLSGLALAIGILVDQATVTIENIHQHLEMGKTKRAAILDACTEISFPLLLILLCILAVFAPSFVMNGVPKAMFLPLSLSIAFAMIVSFIAAQTLVPVISNWLLKAEMFQHYRQDETHAHAGMVLDQGELKEVQYHEREEAAHPEQNQFFQRIKIALASRLTKWMPYRKILVPIYLLLAFAGAGICFFVIGKDLLPKNNVGQLQLRIREPDGTRLEVTESATKRILTIIDSTVNGHVDISSAHVGLIPSNFGTSNLYIFSSGTHEALIQVNIDEKFKVHLDDLKDELRKNILKEYPNIRLSFEPIELTEKIMAQGAFTPIEVRIAGKNMNDIENFADSLVGKLRSISYLRDVQIAQPLKVPTLNIEISRSKLALMGLSIEAVSKS